MYRQEIAFLVFSNFEDFEKGGLLFKERLCSKREMLNFKVHINFNQFLCNFEMFRSQLLSFFIAEYLINCS